MCYSERTRDSTLAGQVGKKTPNSPTFVRIDDLFSLQIDILRIWLWAKQHDRAQINDL